MPRVPMLTPDLKFCLTPLPTNFSTQIKEVSSFFLEKKIHEYYVYYELYEYALS